MLEEKGANRIGPQALNKLVLFYPAIKSDKSCHN
jgi:hypothetical protein